MTRAVWREFICAPERAGRHLSSIGRSVSGAVSDPIDYAVLQAFLEKLQGVDDDIALLGNAVDLVVGGYSRFANSALPRALDALSNEILSTEDVVGPGLRGNPRWDRTIVRRTAGMLSPTHFVSRLPHRSFELPENQLLRWLVDDISDSIEAIEQRVGTANLHGDLLMLRTTCQAAGAHQWLEGVSPPPRLTPAMIAAARRHRRPEYRLAAALADRRMNIEASDRSQWLYTVSALLAVNWLEPINDDDLFELYMLVLTLDVLSNEVGLGEPIEYGLVISERDHIALFQGEQQTVRVFFDQAPATVLGVSTEYRSAMRLHTGISGNERRPDILVVSETPSSTSVVLVEAKRSSDGRYISDSVYKAFGYLYDLRDLALSGVSVAAILAVPTGVAAAGAVTSKRSLYVTSGDDRTDFAASLRAAIHNRI